MITKSSQAYVVRGIGLINDTKEIENIVVKNINGTPILVKHLANVHESSLPRLGQVGRMEEDDVVQGIVVMRKGENPGEVIAALKEKIADIQENALPEDVRIVSFYDREDLVDLAVRTVTHNLAEGILLVTFIVLIFMADWRTTVIVSIIIPLALLFAFICLRAMGMSANLLSMGAIDFGIIIDGAVVMVEGLFVALDRNACLQCDEQDGTDSPDGQRQGEGGVLLQANHYYGTGSDIRFSEGGREDVQSAGIYARVCLAGGFDIYVDISPGAFFDAVEKECA